MANNKNKLYIFIFVVIFALILSISNVFFFASEHMPEWDLGIYNYIGHLVAKGYMPYKDAFDHKGPLLYVIYALGNIINPRWGMWIINYITMTGIIGISFKTANKFVNQIWAIFICLIIYTGFLKLDFGCGTPEYFACLFLAAALYFITDYYTKNDIRYINVILIGIFCACVFWLKHSTLITVLVMCGLVIFDCILKKNFKYVIKYIIFFAAGFCILSSFVCGWILINHAGHEMWQDYFLANIEYTENISILSRCKALLYLMLHPSVVAVGIILFLYLLYKISFSTRTENQNLSQLLLHSILSGLITLVFLALPGRDYYHYLSSVFPVLVLTAACAVKSLNTVEIKERRLLQIAGIIIAGCMIVYPDMSQIYTLCSDSWAKNDTFDKITATLNKYIGPDEKIAVLGGQGGIYLACGHESATTFPYISSIVLENPDRMAEYKGQIGTNEPAAIIVEYWASINEILGYDIVKDYYLVDDSDYDIYVRKDIISFDDTINELKATVDIESYLSLLSKLDDYTIFFAVKDSAGNNDIHGVQEYLHNMGFRQINRLFDGNYHTFAGIINKGTVEYEKLDEAENAIKYDTIIEKNTIHLISQTFHYGNQAVISINEKDYAINGRGINIVVYNNKSMEVVDSVAFDTYDPQCPASRSETLLAH